MTDNRRNGYSYKNIKTTCGETSVAAPGDRDATFEPQAVPQNG